jgi:hypothetical protein
MDERGVERERERERERGTALKNANYEKARISNADKRCLASL